MPHLLLLVQSLRYSQYLFGHGSPSQIWGGSAEGNRVSMLPIEIWLCFQLKYLLFHVIGLIPRCLPVSLRSLGSQRGFTSFQPLLTR